MERSYVCDGMGVKASVLILVFLTFVMGTSEFMIMGILPDMARGLGVEYTMIGGLVSVYALSYAVFTPTISAFIGRFDRFLVLMATIILFLVSDVWTMVASGYVSIALSRVMTAATSGVMFSVAMAYAVDIVPREMRASTLAWMYAGFNISSIVGVPFGTVLSNIFGWRSVFVLIMAMSLLAILFSVFVLPRTSGPSEAVRGGGSLEMIRDPRVVAGFLITMFAFGGSYVVFTYITPILEDVIGFPDEYVGIGLMMFGIMCFISNLAAGKVSSHGGLRSGRAILLVQMVVMLLLPLSMTGAVTGFVLLMAVGLLMYITNSSVQMLLMDVAGRDYPGSLTLAASLNPTAFSVGIVLGSQVAGVIYDSTGPSELGYGAAVLVLVAMSLTVWVCRYCHRPGKGTSVT